MLGRLGAPVGLICAPDALQCPPSLSRPQPTSGFSQYLTPSSCPSQPDPDRLSTGEVVSGGCPHLPECQPRSSVHRVLTVAAVCQGRQVAGSSTGAPGPWRVETCPSVPSTQHRRVAHRKRLGASG